MKPGVSKPALLACALALAAGGAHAGECPPPADAAAKPQASAAAPAQAYHYNPWADFTRMQAALDRQFNAMNALWLPVMFAPQPAFSLPAAFALPTPVSTLQHTRDGYRLELPLPGFKPEDIHVRLDGQLLAISAQTSSTVKVGQHDEQSQSSRSFAETLTLPGPVQAAELKESYQDGVLILTIPSQKGPAGKV